MIYLQLKSRVILSPQEELKVRHIADVQCDDKALERTMLNTSIPFTQSPGIWKLPAIGVIHSLTAFGQDIVPLGEQECYIHIIPNEKQNRVNIPRSVFAFLLLFFGSLLAITWFHADVNMQQAQQTFYRMITGKQIENPLFLAVPYAIGVFFGVALFYTLLGKKGTISPLDIKLHEYHTSSEKAAGKES